MRSNLIAGWIFGAALAAGCGGSDTNETTSGTTSTTTTGQGGDATGGAGGDGAGGNNTGGNGAGGASTGGGGAGGSTTTASTGGGGAGGSTTTTSTTTCAPTTQDATKIGTDCADSMICPTGYVCQPFSGILVSYHCAILCEQDCQCPGGTTCETMSDKAGDWMECLDL